ncbi:MAG TPA: DNA mismatch repair protein MutS, partial [Parasegetibacter sp.]
MKLFPESAYIQLEFDKIKDLLHAHGKTEYARDKASNLRIHTHKLHIETELSQTHEFVQIIQSGVNFPYSPSLNLSRHIKLLSIPGAMLSGEEFLLIRKLADHIRQVYRWFNVERKTTYPALTKVIESGYYEPAVITMIDEIIDEQGNVKDDASPELQRIRMSLFRKRNELRRIFDKIISRLNKQGYLADIEESFLNGRRVVAVFAEQKRQVKGILHGESDTRKTSFIEPEETIPYNNEIYSLENEETKEVHRILRELSSNLSVYSDLLKDYHNILGEFDFINAKAKLALDVNGVLPSLSDKSEIHIINGYHPLLYLYNKRSGKLTVPVTLRLDNKNRILVISGPNAGGKTVTMKTVGLLQLMLQSGLLVPVHPDSRIGIFKSLMIHIGDTQSLEFELSTYSSHLKNMKHFMEFANGRTLFFIDELGSGSDPNLGGAFAEVIMEELAHKHAIGIVTTHYLNLKVMAGKVPGIINGAMAFDEEKLLPLYRLIVGKPGSSYTFSIAQRIGLHPSLIARARKMVDEQHFRLDKLLNHTEQDLRKVEEKELELQKLMNENLR